MPPLYDVHWPDFPPVIVPPVYIPPVEPPCDEDNPDDDECEEPEKPPVDAPEPGLLFLLALGGGICWTTRRKAPPAA